MFELTGVERSPVYGVRLQRAYLFCRGGKIGLTTHLYGIKESGNTQVCSPIRSIEKIDNEYVFVTRSYNKYVVAEQDFAKVNEDSKDNLSVCLYGWLGTDKILHVYDHTDTRIQTIALFSGEPAPIEKQLYGLK